MAGICALIYNRLLKYRKTKDSKKYWIIHQFVGNRILGQGIFYFGVVIMTIDIIIAQPANADP